MKSISSVFEKYQRQREVLSQALKKQIARLLSSFMTKMVGEELGNAMKMNGVISAEQDEQNKYLKMHHEALIKAGLLEDENAN